MFVHAVQLQRIDVERDVADRLPRLAEVDHLRKVGRRESSKDRPQLIEDPSDRILRQIVEVRASDQLDDPGRKLGHHLRWTNALLF